jgi:hypothetical protein
VLENISNGIPSVVRAAKLVVLSQQPATAKEQNAATIFAVQGASTVQTNALNNVMRYSGT